MPDKIERLNPQIKTTTIGVRTLREITLYPLAVGEQLKLSDMITETLQRFHTNDDKADIEFVEFLVELLKRNLAKILSLITDEDGEKLIGEMTNNQAVDVAEIVYEMNYDVAGKKLMGLITKAKQIQAG